MATVNGVLAVADVRGIVHGTGGAVDKLAGGAGKDILQGHASFNQYYGGAGDDTFVISSKFGTKTGAASKDFADQAHHITDFAGAGVQGGDFVAFSGFGAGSSLTLTHTGTSGTSGATLYYYAITDGVTGDVTNVLINSLSGKALGAGDYAFY